MKKRWIPIVCALILILTILACGTSTSGSVTGSSQSCQRVGTQGVCEGNFGKLKGTYGLDVEDDGISSTDEIDVEATVNVGSGSIKISVTDPEGSTTSIQAAPGQPATLIGVAKGEFSAFKVTFQALEDEAKDVQYTISYQIR